MKVIIETNVWDGKSLLIKRSINLYIDNKVGNSFSGPDFEIGRLEIEVKSKSVCIRCLSKLGISDFDWF